MRASSPVLTGVVTVLMVATAAVLLTPGVFMALIVGYGWTYAYGGTLGVLFGTLCLWVGTLLGCVITFYLGQQGW